MVNMLNFIFGLKNHIAIIFQNERRIKMKFKEIEIGKSEQIRALLTGIEERGAKAGTRYLVLNFTDGEQTVTANYWNCTRDEFTAKEGQVLDLRVDAKLYKGSTSYTVQSYLLTDESPEAYVTSAPMDPVDMFNKIHSFAANLGVYGMLVCTLLEENREKLLTWAAGKSVHHNIRGGLLYHTYTMLQSAITLTAWMLRCTCSGQQGKKQNREKCLTGYSPWTAGCTIQKIEFEFTFLCLRKGAFFYEI